MPTYPKPIKDNLFLEIDKALIDEVVTENGFKLYLAPEYNFEHNVCVSGKVAVLPESYKGDLEIGNEVAFSYRVVSEREFPDTADHFVEVSEGSPHVRIWANKKGEKLRLLARPGIITLTWTGTFFNKKGEFQHGFQGTESEAGRWISQFKFGNTEGFLYKNQINYNGNEYWKCKSAEVFAKRVNGEITTVGDRIVCEPMSVPAEELRGIVGKLALPDSSIELRFYDRARVVSGGEDMGIKKGDVISFESRFCEKYEMWGKEYFLIKKNRVQGIWQDQ